MLIPAGDLVGANGGLAEKSLSQDRGDTAARALADVGANGLEVRGARGNLAGVGAVEVSNTENVGGTALGSAVEDAVVAASNEAVATAATAVAGVVVGREGEGGGSEGRDDHGGELHLDGCLRVKRTKCSMKEG